MSQSTTPRHSCHFSPHAALAALGVLLRRQQVFAPIAELVRIEQKVIKDKAKVSQAQITKYYNENKARYNTPEKRNALVIQTSTEAPAKKAKKELESGKSFASGLHQHLLVNRTFNAELDVRFQCAFG